MTHVSQSDRDPDPLPDPEPDPTTANNPRLWKALTEPMFVYEDHPDAPLDCEAVVYNAGREYLVNLAVNFCTCPDQQYNCGPGEPCKHLLRARLVSRGSPLPEWAEWDALDSQLRRRLAER